jgi:hypothetical protein
MRLTKQRRLALAQRFAALVQQLEKEGYTKRQILRGALDGREYAEYGLMTGIRDVDDERSDQNCEIQNEVVASQSHAAAAVPDREPQPDPVLEGLKQLARRLYPDTKF